MPEMHAIFFFVEKNNIYTVA